jgi:hypothetical protein
MLRRTFRRILTPPMVVLAVLFLFVEEWLWDKLTAATAWLARAPFFVWLEAQVRLLPAWAAIAGFFLPGLLLLPVKIGALFLIGRGHMAWGITVIVMAKVLGTAVVARFFLVCKPTLMGVGWFRAGHDWLLRMKAALYERLHAMSWWQTAVHFKERVKRRLRLIKPGMIARRWRAIGQCLRLRWRRRVQ